MVGTLQHEQQIGPDPACARSLLILTLGHSMHEAHALRPAACPGRPGCCFRYVDGASDVTLWIFAAARHTQCWDQRHRAEHLCCCPRVRETHNTELICLLAGRRLAHTSAGCSPTPRAISALSCPANQVNRSAARGMGHEVVSTMP